MNNRVCSTQEGSSTSVPHLSVILTVRLLMQGKEVGSIIGKRGDHIKLIRDGSGAKINISDGSCPERIVTITGTTETINKAFVMICAKLQQDLQALPNSVPKPPITMRLIVPATQCGCIIGKGGSKIKEIREATGASIQVASEMLPSSTERAVTISGSADSIVLCMRHICQILLEAPAKGTTLPYRPKPTFNPALLASSAAAAAASLIQQQPYPTLINPLDLVRVPSPYVATTQLLPTVPALNPYTVFGNGLMTVPVKTDTTAAATVADQQQQQAAAAAAAAALQWATAAGYDEKQQADFAQTFINSQYPSVGGNILLGHTAALAAKAAAKHQQRQDNVASPTRISPVLLQQNTRRFTPY